MNAKKTLIIFLLVFASAQSVFALGALFSRPLGSNTEYDKVWIKSVDATVEIEGQIAVTYIDQVFRNELNQTVEAVCIFPLPDNAVVTELFYWFNGEWYEGAIKEREEAKQEYNEKIRQYLDPALLEYLGNNLYRLSIAPIFGASDVRVKITYVELLPYEFGTIDYTFLLNATEISPKPLERVSVSGTIVTENNIKSVDTPGMDSSTALNITKESENKYNLIFGDENFVPTQDLTVQFETIREQVQVNVLTYTPTEDDSIGDDSYYATWITPPDEISDDEDIPKKIVFTADVSSSMEGTRIIQLKESLMAFLDNLQQDDQFNIITFGTTVQLFKSNLVYATPDKINEAQAFVTNIGALGLTNIDEAMQVSLNQSFSNEFSNMLVFLTDGYPTWGETFIPNILANVAEYNTQDVRIFSFGVGEDVSEQLLVQMAVENGGYAEFITEDDDIYTTISNHFQRISKPVLTDLDIKIEGLSTSDKYPRPLPDLFWGNQVMQMGIYTNEGNFKVYLTGEVSGQQKSFMSDAGFSRQPGGHRFIPRLWAKAKIDYLLDQIAIYGELDELVDQVIELSLKFQILTPYTAFYSDPSTDIDKDIIVPEEFVLNQNYPNPFNPSTTISYSIPSSGHVTIKIYDITGRLVNVLYNNTQQAGTHSLAWNGTDLNGHLVAAGIYLYQIEYTNVFGQRFTLSKKMSFVK